MNGLGSASTARIVTVVGGTCLPTATSLCLNDSRFRVTANCRLINGTTGQGQAVSLTADTGDFWFFDPANIEVVTKVLGFCANSFNSYWVFAAGLTNLEVELTYTDTLRDVTKVYRNPLRTPCQPIQDTAAFATCP
jgi:hypothetical protein